MQGRRSALVVVLTPEEEERLSHWVRSTTTPAGISRRAQAVLSVSQGRRLTEAARDCGMTEKHVRKWLKRFLTHRLQGLNDLPGRGRKPFFPLGGRDLCRQDGV